MLTPRKLAKRCIEKMLNARFPSKMKDKWLSLNPEPRAITSSPSNTRPSGSSKRRGAYDPSALRGISETRFLRIVDRALLLALAGILGVLAAASIVSVVVALGAVLCGVLVAAFGLLNVVFLRMRAARSRDRDARIRDIRSRYTTSH